MPWLELISILVCIAALFGWLSSRLLKLPITIGTMILTIAASLLLLATSSYAPRLHAVAANVVQSIDFEFLILHGMLPLLLFAGAFLLDLEYLVKEKFIVFVLSLFGTILSAVATAALMHTILPLFSIKPTWLPCLFFGALISPTDPIAVLEMLRRVGVPKNIQAQLAGESLFNDGVGAVLFLALLEASHGAEPTLLGVVLSLVLKAGGGLLLGILGAWLVSLLLDATMPYQVEVLLTLGLAMGGYALADRLHISAPLEAVAAAIALRHFHRKREHLGRSHATIDAFWEVIDEVQNSVLFVLLGLEILAISFHRDSVETGLTAIVVVSLVRLAVVGLLITLARRLQPGHRSSIKLLSWGGLRGGLSIALALAVPRADGRTWILATTYLVVVFSIIVQGGSMDLALKHMRERRRRQRTVAA